VSYPIRRCLWAATFVEADILLDRGRFRGGPGLGSWVDFLVFDSPPEALNEDIVPPGALSVHADPDLTCCQHLDEVSGGELAGLIGIEGFGLCVISQGLIQRIEAELVLHSV
jgi:hypothetical protein